MAKRIMSKQEKMKAEAVKRMRMLQLDEKIIKNFEKRDLLCCSWNISKHIKSPKVDVYLLDKDSIDKEGVKPSWSAFVKDIHKLVSDYEKRTNNLVYHVILGSFEKLPGIVETLLFVSQDEEDWGMENAVLKPKKDDEGTLYCVPFAFSRSFMAEEAGSVWLKYLNGSLYRFA